MTIYSALTALTKQLERLDNELRNLEWAVIQAKPGTSTGDRLAGDLFDAIQEMRGQVHHACELAQLGREAVESRTDLAGVFQALCGCQEHAQQVVKLYYSRLSCPEVWESLSWLSKGQRSDWAAWVAGVRDALPGLADALLTGESGNVSQSLHTGWREIGDLAGWAQRPGMSLQPRPLPAPPSGHIE